MSFTHWIILVALLAFVCGAGLTSMLYDRFVSTLRRENRAMLETIAALTLALLRSRQAKDEKTFEEYFDSRSKPPACSCHAGDSPAEWHLTWCSRYKPLVQQADDILAERKLEAVPDCESASERTIWPSRWGI